MHHTVLTYPFPTDGTGAGSAAAAKLLVNCSSFCLTQKTAGASWLGYMDRDTAEIHRAWRASRATAARAALLAPNMLHTLVGELQSGWIHGFSLADAVLHTVPSVLSPFLPSWRHLRHGFIVHAPQSNSETLRFEAFESLTFQKTRPAPELYVQNIVYSPSVHY